METAIVTVRQRDENLERDLEIPVQMEAGRVAQMIAEALGLVETTQAPVPELRILATLPGGQTCNLGSEDRLDEAGIWDGAYLELERVPTRSREQLSHLRTSSGAQFPLSGAQVSVGRPRMGEGRAALLDLTNEQYGHTVSRPHAVLRQRDGLWEAREVLDGTENGTYLNGRKLVPGEWVILQDEDVLRLGWVELRFHQGE